MRGSIARILAGLSVLLLAILVLEWTGGGEEPVVKPPTAHRLAMATPADSEARDTSDWSDTILARPLFSSNRRKGAGTAGAPMPRLAGIMITPRGRRAIFAPDGGGKQLVLSEGATVNDVAIRSIQPDRVILASGAVLLLAYDKQRGSGGTPQPFVPIQPNLPQPGFSPQGMPPNPIGLNPMGLGPNGTPFPNRGFPNPRSPTQFPGITPNMPSPADSAPNPATANPAGQDPAGSGQAASTPDADDSDATPPAAQQTPTNQTETPPVPRPGPQRRE